MTGRFLVPGGDVGGPGSEGRGPLSGLNAVGPLKKRQIITCVALVSSYNKMPTVNLRDTLDIKNNIANPMQHLGFYVFGDRRGKNKGLKPNHLHIFDLTSCLIQTA